MFKKSCIIASLLSIIAGVLIALLLDGIAMKIIMGAALIIVEFVFWMCMIYMLFNKANNKRKYYVPFCVCALITTYSIVIVSSNCTAYQNLPTVIRIGICISSFLAFCGVGYFGYKAALNEQKNNEVEVNETEGLKISPKPKLVYDERTALFVEPEKLCCDVLWTDIGFKYVEHIDKD